MEYGSKPLPTRASDLRATTAIGAQSPSGVTEAVSDFYNGFLVFVFMAVTAVGALILVWLLYEFNVAEFRQQKDALLLAIVYLAAVYLIFVLSVGITATFLSMRRHLVYQSRLLEVMARNAIQQQPRQDDIFG